MLVRAGSAQPFIPSRDPIASQEHMNLICAVGRETLIDNSVHLLDLPLVHGCKFIKARMLAHTSSCEERRTAQCGSARSECGTTPSGCCRTPIRVPTSTPPGPSGRVTCISRSSARTYLLINNTISGQVSSMCSRATVSPSPPRSRSSPGQAKHVVATPPAELLDAIRESHPIPSSSTACAPRGWSTSLTSHLGKAEPIQRIAIHLPRGRRAAGASIPPSSQPDATPNHNGKAGATSRRRTALTTTSQRHPRSRWEPDLLPPSCSGRWPCGSTGFGGACPNGST